jgi:ribosomal-protein-alanine N-acetyltransferase
MNATDAHLIARWHYVEPYTFYDLDQDPADREALLDPQRWPGHYYSVLDESGTLIGFFGFQNHEDTIEIGLGLRPDLTGKGVGRDFVQAGRAFAEHQFAPTTFVWLLRRSIKELSTCMRRLAFSLQDAMCKRRTAASTRSLK